MANLSPITVARFWSKTEIPPAGRDGCWIWNGAVAGSGYGSFSVPAMDGKAVSAHRIAYRLVFGEWPPAGLLVRHKCDNPRCVNPDHLELGDHVDNARDMVERGRNFVRSQTGEQNGRARLTAADVEDVREMIDLGWTNVAIAKLFCVHHATISAIRRGKSWAAPSVPAR